MDLLAITSGAIGAINPYTAMTIRVSTGNTIAPDGMQQPTYDTLTGISGQVQPLTGKDLRQLEALNIQGSLRAIYLEGHYDAIVRVSQKGGDLVTDADGTVWLVTQVLERWPEWCRVAVTLQTDGP